jgi:hypothetical protein
VPSRTATSGGRAAPAAPLSRMPCACMWANASRNHGSASSGTAGTKAEVLVARAWEEGTSGAVAVVGGETAGYLIGSVNENEWWNRHVWIGLAGHATRDPEAVRDLYRAAAGRWVEDGAKLHAASPTGASSGSAARWRSCRAARSPAAASTSAALRPEAPAQSS